MLRLPTRRLPDVIATRASATGAAARGATALGGVATGALAVGSAAIGALAVGKASIGRLAVHGARVRRLEIDELVVHDVQLAAAGKSGAMQAAGVGVPGPAGAADSPADAAARERVTSWVTAYETAWRTAGTAMLDGLFTADATYRPGPWEEPRRGLEAIKTFWDETRDGPDEQFTLTVEPVAVDGDTAVVRTAVEYGGARVRRWRNLWVIAFAADGRVRAFEEWPFAPERMGSGS